jgi:hypothetical protein
MIFMSLRVRLTLNSDHAYDTIRTTHPKDRNGEDFSYIYSERFGRNENLIAFLE